MIDIYTRNIQNTTWLVTFVKLLAFDLVTKNIC